MSPTSITGACCASLLATIALALPAPAGADKGMSKAELKMVKVINKMRARRGLAKLRPHGALANAAEDHSSDMANNQFFAHTSYNGTDPYNRVMRYIRKNVMGETLAYMPISGNTRARHILRLWMHSPGHRRTLTTRRFRRIGIGRARGWLNGRKVVFWTADLTSAR